MLNRSRIPTAIALFLFVVLMWGQNARAALPHVISVDGDFSDWANVPSYSDPVGGPGVLHDGVPDTHDTDGRSPGDVPAYENHPDIDLVEYKFTHDQDNLYAYFRATGEIGRTISNTNQHGRYYVIITLDVDNNNATGYELCEGGYFPTSNGYDMNMEVEFYDGEFNTGHYLNHGALNQSQLDAAVEDQKNGIVNVLPGTYDYYSQWVWFDDTTSGDFLLPAPDDDASITFVFDKGPVYQGILEIALSADGHEAEMVAPFRGFMRDDAGNPIIALGKTIDISFSLEASGELSPGRSWASDTGDPIVGYYLAEPLLGDANIDGIVDDADAAIVTENWLSSNNVGWGQGDFNGDGIVDDSDATTLAANWQAGAANSTTIPEPATMCLLGVGVLVLLGVRRPYS